MSSLEEELEFDENLTCLHLPVEVVSTRYGTVHQNGGMETGVFYLSLSGAMEEYDDEGWSDPEKMHPAAFNKRREILFGDSQFLTEKYTPQFGG